MCQTAKIHFIVTALRAALTKPTCKHDVVVCMTYYDSQRLHVTFLHIRTPIVHSDLRWLGYHNLTIYGDCRTP